MLTPRLRRDEGWLLYDAPVPSGSSRCCEDLLAWSGALPGGCKFGAGASGAAVVLAEIPSGTAFAERCSAVESGFAVAAARLGLAAEPALAARALPAAQPLDLGASCREAAWPFEERADGSLVVDLGVPGGYVPGLIAAKGADVVVEADLTELPEAGSVRRRALAALLLRVNAAFRMVRAVLAPGGERAVLEARIPHQACAADLGVAISAVAVAARSCALEALLVAQDEDVARAFLERSGMFPPA